MAAMSYEGFMNDFHQNKDDAMKNLDKLVNNPVAIASENENKQKEAIIMKVGAELAKTGDSAHLRRLIDIVKPTVAGMGKAKAANMIRNLLDGFLDIPGVTEEDKTTKVDVCRDCIAWAKDQKRVFLRQTLESRLIRLFNDIEQYKDASALAAGLVKELKKVDDKDLIVEVQLEESKALFYQNNLSKARAALTSARTTANSIYISPQIQAALDMQSGILHAADEKDFKTAYSYFYEAFEGYDTVPGRREDALRALKYMLLSKIMLGKADEVAGILSGRLASSAKYQDRAIEVMKEIADAAKRRSLADFKMTFGHSGLSKDPVVKAHFQALHDSMLESNLARIIQPYSRVEIDYVAEQINLDRNLVERTLSTMILDDKISGILDQGEHVLVLFPATVKDAAFEASLQHIKAMEKLVEALHGLANTLT